MHSYIYSKYKHRTNSIVGNGEREDQPLLEVRSLPRIKSVVSSHERIRGVLVHDTTFRNLQSRLGDRLLRTRVSCAPNGTVPKGICCACFLPAPVEPLSFVDRAGGSTYQAEVAPRRCGKNRRTRENRQRFC